MPFHPQQEQYCGPAALATVLGWSGLPARQEALAREVFTPGREGTLGHDLIGAARRHGRLAVPVADLPSLLGELAAGHPVLVLQNLALDWYPQWHFAVAVGYDLNTGELTLRSGEERRQVVALDTFDRTWARADHWALVVLPPDQLPAHADEAAVLSAASGLERVGRLDEAALAYDAVLRRWPDSLEALIGRGNARYAARDLDGAEAAYRAALERHPGAAAAWNNLADVLAARGRTDGSPDRRPARGRARRRACRALPAHARGNHRRTSVVAPPFVRRTRLPPAPGSLTSSAWSATGHPCPRQKPPGHPRPAAGRTPHPVSAAVIKAGTACRTGGCSRARRPAPPAHPHPRSGAFIGGWSGHARPGRMAAVAARGDAHGAVVSQPGRSGGPWRAELQARIPELDVRIWPQVGDPAEIDLALVWRPPPGELARYPNLRAILSLAAGIDGLIADPDLPDVPIARMVDPSLTRTMTEYVLLAVLRHHREFDRFERAQRAREWAYAFPPQAAERRVGSWVWASSAPRRRARSWPTASRCWAGAAARRRSMASSAIAGRSELHAFLHRTDILVCLLPLTADTVGILDAATFAELPHGACVINVARGQHLVEGDLVQALDSGHLGGATLDVFREEPLPPGSPLWDHPKVLVTPHVASYSVPATAADGVATNIRRALAGEPLLHQVDRARGY